MKRTLRLSMIATARTFCVSLFVGCLLIDTVSAAPVVDINFSGDTPGGPPSTTFLPPAGEIVVKPNMLSNPAAFTVAENYETGGVTLPGSSVVFRVEKPVGEPSVGGSMSIWGAEADFVVGQDYSLKLDLLFNGSYGDLASSSLAINLYNAAYDYTGYQARLIFSNNNLVLFSNATSPKVYNNKWQSDSLISLEIRMLYSTSRAEVYIDNVFAGDIVLDPAAPAGIYGFQFSNGDANNSHFEVGITNIQGASIPEPATASAMLIGGLALIAGKRFWATKGEK